MENKLVELFNIPNIKVEVDTIWLFNHIMKDNYFSAHLMTRLLAIRNYFNENDYGWKLYNKMQNERVASNPLVPKYMADHEEQFKELITNIYNEYLSISANFVPVNVAGPAKYNSNKFEKVADRMDKKIDEINDKINKFYDNTESMLKNAYSKDEIILKYKNGYNEPISSDDPLAREKLEAKLEYLQTKHQSYLDFNKKARLNKTEQLPPYVLANSNQNMKAVKDRLQTLDKIDNIETGRYYFDNGEVSFDKEDMRVKVFFDEKPDEKTRDELKSRGFKWSPKNSAWQRKLTPNAIYITKRMFKDIGSLEIKLVNDYTKTI